MIGGNITLPNSDMTFASADKYGNSFDNNPLNTMFTQADDGGGLLSHFDHGALSNLMASN